MEPVSEPLWPDGPVFTQSEHFRLGTDSILLADFVRPGRAKKGIDLGCGSGILMLLLLNRCPSLHMTGLEILSEAADCAAVNMRANRLEDRSCVLTGDVRDCRSLFAAGSMDLVISNPPYFPPSGGLTAPDPNRAGARAELNFGLEELCSAASRLLHTGGTLALVHRAERLSELFCAMTVCGIEPKRLRWVQARPGAAPGLVLVEGRRGGHPGLVTEPPLILTEADGSESEEYRRIYHRL